LLIKLLIACHLFHRFSRANIRPRSLAPWRWKGARLPFALKPFENEAFLSLVPQYCFRIRRNLACTLPNPYSALALAVPSGPEQVNTQKKNQE
jgi:hypothetical protein